MILPDFVLVDSSVWVEFFRKGTGEASEKLDKLLASGRAVTCGIVEMELLAGLRDKEARTLASLFSALPYLEIIREDFVGAGNVLKELRQKGITVPATDALIAAVCLRCHAALLTLDHHFSYFTKLKRI